MGLGAGKLGVVAAIPGPYPQLVEMPQDAGRILVDPARLDPVTALKAE
jgi:hypothetical protein